MRSKDWRGDEEATASVNTSLTQAIQLTYLLCSENPKLHRKFLGVTYYLVNLSSIYIIIIIIFMNRKTVIST